MKKTVFSIIMLIISLVVVLAACGGAPASEQGNSNNPSAGESGKSAGEPIVLKLADTFPTTHGMNRVTNEVFIKKLEESGKVKIEYYPAGQMGTAEDMLDLVKGGSVDIAYVSPGFLAGQLPLSTVISLPNVFNTPQEGTEVYWRLMEGILKPEFEKNGVIPVWVSLTPSYEIMTNKKQVKLPQDVQGLKIRGGGGDADVTLSLLGAVPVNMPTADMYEALQRGVVDGVSTNFASANSYKLLELIKYSTEGANLGSIATVHVLNANKWNSLPQDIQDLIIKAGKEASQAAADMWAEEDAEAKEVFKKQGGQIYTLTDQDKEAWKKAVQLAGEQWISSLEKKGYANAKDVYQEMMTIAQEIVK